MTEPETNPGEGANAELSPILIHLLKGVLYAESDTPLWAALLRLQARVREYVQVIGLQLVLDEAEGYSFLRSMNEEDAADEGAKPLPRLISRRRLSFPVSLLLALLRKRMAEADSGGGSTRLILSRDEIASLMRVFLAESSNEARIMDQIETHISKVVDLGFLRKLKSTNPQAPAGYEVMRILKAFVDAQWLAEFDARLADYAKQARGGDQEETDHA